MAGLISLPTSGQSSHVLGFKGDFKSFGFQGPISDLYIMNKLRKKRDERIDSEGCLGSALTVTARALSTQLKALSLDRWGIQVCSVWSFLLGFKLEDLNSIVVTGQEWEVSGPQLSSHALSPMRWRT